MSDGVSEGDLREVVVGEQRLLDPEVRARPAQVEALLHPDFVEFGANGQVYTRDFIVTALAADPGVSGEGTDYATTVLADDVILLTYRVVGPPASLRSSVWVRDAGAWRMRFHQGTRVPAGS